MTELFRWPAAVCRVIPKDRLYVEAGVPKSVRQRLIDDIQRVRSAYKLREESLGHRGRDEVAEVQVFEIEFKELVAAQFTSILDVAAGDVGAA